MYCSSRRKRQSQDFGAQKSLYFWLHKRGQHEFDRYTIHCLTVCVMMLLTAVQCIRFFSQLLRNTRTVHVFGLHILLLYLVFRLYFANQFCFLLFDLFKTRIVDQNSITSSGGANPWRKHNALVAIATGKFNMDIGSTYEYDYTSEMKTMMMGSSDEHSSLHMASSVHIEVLDQCEMALKVRLRYDL